MTNDICMDPVRSDWEAVKDHFQRLVAEHKPQGGVAQSQVGAWLYAESTAAVRTIERTLKYELKDERALADIADYYRKTGVAYGGNPPDTYKQLGIAIQNLAADIQAEKQSNSPRLAYKAIVHYLRAAEAGFETLAAETASYWSAGLPADLADQLKKELVVIRGDKAKAHYEDEKDCQKSIWGAIHIAEAAAQYVTGCVSYEKAGRAYRQLRVALHEVRAGYCRILCITRHLGIAVQPGVADNVRIAFIENARYLELALRTFESITPQQADYVAELKMAWTRIATQVQILQAEITRWSSTQTSQVSADWQTNITSLNTYIQQATTQVNSLQGAAASADRKTISQITAYANQADDAVRLLYCRFERHHGFRIEVFDAFWEWLIEIRCAAATYYHEERAGTPTQEEQLAKFFELFDFLKNSASSQPAVAGAAPPAPAGMTAAISPATAPQVSTALVVIPTELPAYWRNAQALIAKLQGITPRLKPDVASQWTAQAQAEVALLQQGPGSQIPTDLLLSQALREWNDLYAKLNVIVAVAKDTDPGTSATQLDAFSASLDLLNQQMWTAFGITAPTSVSAAASGGA